ncbi:sensor histidine kinase [Pedosphaera parvula]|nr:PAS domain S-box protein [Pedosphaera parvula]
MAVLSIAVATLVRMLLDPWLGDHAPFATVFLAILVIAFWAGFGPAVLTIILGYIAVDYFVILPRHSSAISGFSVWAQTLVYAMVSFGIVSLDRLHVAAQSRANQSEEKYRSLYGNTPVMMHSIDQNGTLLNVSNFWLESLGYERSEVIGHKSVEFLTPESRQYALEVVLPEFFETGVCRDIPYQVIKKNGEIIDVLLSAAIEKDRHSGEVHSLAVLIDVTAQKRAEARIKQWNAELESSVRERTAELEAFCYSVSHDLRSPIRQISSFTELLREDYAPLFKEEGREMLRIVIQSAQRMDQLIHDLLALSRLSRCEIQRRPVDLSASLRQLAQQLQKDEPQRQVDFIIAPKILASVDERMLRVALENLLNNAWKFTRLVDRGRIEFGVKLHAGHPTFFLRDNGIGFDMAYAGKLFGVFERLHSASEFPGTGIGLAIVQRVINRHGGEIWAEGAINQGATFYFTLQTQPVGNDGHPQTLESCTAMPEPPAECRKVM